MQSVQKVQQGAVDGGQIIAGMSRERNGIAVTWRIKCVDGIARGERTGQAPQFIDPGAAARDQHDRCSLPDMEVMNPERTGVDKLPVNLSLVGGKLSSVLWGLIAICQVHQS